MTTQTSVSKNQSSKPVSPEWNVTDHIPLEKFTIQSHRGAGTAVLENSIEAMEFSWKLGVVPEADLRMSKDNVLFFLHDINLKPARPGEKPEQVDVSKLTWDEVLALELGESNQGKFVRRPIFKLEEVFKLMKGRPERFLYMDIKNADFEILSKLVKQYGIEQQVIFTSSNHEFLKQWKKLVPTGETLNWVRGTLEYAAPKMKQLEADGYEGITQLQFHIHPNEPVSSNQPYKLPNEFLAEQTRKLREHGILVQVLPWQIDDQKVYNHLLDLGVASFATDFPELTVKYVREYYESRKKLK